MPKTCSSRRMRLPLRLRLCGWCVGMTGRRLLGGSKLGLVIDVALLIAETFGSSKGVDKILGIDGLQALLESFVEKTVAGFGQYIVRQLVQIGGCHLIEDLVLGAANQRLAEVTYPALN